MEHEFYKVLGDFDLGINIYISLKEALLGFSRQVRMLDGTFIRVRRSGVT